MATITFENPNSNFVWKNKCSEPVRVVCEGLVDTVVAPRDELHSAFFRAVNNTAAVMFFSIADQPVGDLTLRWRTVADKFVLTRETSDSAEHVEIMVDRAKLSYCMDLSTNTDTPGIVIVGTIDTK